MTTRQVDQDVALVLDSELWDVSTVPAKRGMPPLGGFGGGPVPRTEGVKPPGATTWLVERLISGDKFSARAPIELTAKRGGAFRAMQAEGAPEIQVDLAHDEAAVLLVESEGVVGWQFPDSVAPVKAGDVRAVRGEQSAKRAVFRVTVPSGVHLPSAGSSRTGS